MMKNRTTTAFLSLAAVISLSMPAISFADEPTLEQRVVTLERIVKGQGLLNLLTRVDQLNNEVKNLKGDNEALQHQIDQMKKSQQQMYIDLDNKLSQQPAATTQQPVNPSTTASSPASNASQATNAAPTAGDGEDDYQAALRSVRSGQYKQAITAFDAFSKKYPNSQYLPNVYYWEGAVKYILLEYADANKFFNKVITEYPKSTKVPDAMLKLGFSQQQMGDTDASTKTLNQLIKQYPNSEAAKYAKARVASTNK